MADRFRDLEKPLIEKKRGGTSYALSIDELGDLFKPDNVKDGISRKRLKDYGGVEGLLNKIRIDVNQGVKNRSDKEDRMREFGDNKPIVRPQKSIVELVTEQFEDKILQILCAASAISMIVGIIKEGWAKGWMEGLAILIAVIIIVSVTAANNYIKDKQFRTLFAQSEIREVRVLRSGKVESVSIFDLVVGDLLYIETGDILPVDGVLVKSNNIEADESSITGESDLIHKCVPTNYSEEEKANPFIISGSKMMEGTGLMVVAAVGINSQAGKLKSKLQEEEDETPLQLKLAAMADDIGRFGFTAASVTVGAMIIHLIVEIVMSNNAPAGAEHGAHDFSGLQILKYIVEFFILGVTIIVMAVPEGLPLAVVIALAYSVGKMKDENNLVRFLQACETMGGADNICSDKTGTLTKNLMTVTTIFVEETVHTKIDKNIISEGTRTILGESISINSNAFPVIMKDGKFDHKGNKTECALLEHAYKLGYNYENYRPSDKIKRVITFSSKRKRMSTVWQVNENLVRIYCKGAPDMILEKCTDYINKDGAKTRMTEDFKNRILHKVVKPFARQSLRTILLAYKEMNVQRNITSFDGFSEDHLENDLTFIAIAGIKDPLRDEIPEAIKKCRTAGITVRMVTGDNRDTAVAISKDAGILPKDFEDSPETMEVMEGKDFRVQVGGLVEATKTEPSRVRDINAFEVIANSLKVLARSSPEDKYLLVTGLKQLNKVVAVTGDGTNDAPALKKADIGFAMGIAGTEVAKEAAGIILLDDNFSSIVTAVKWGRNIFDCIRKFLQFQLTINVVALTMAFIGGLSSRESPLNTIQILWVNLIMDTFAALALATEPPTDDLLKRKPYSRTESLLTPNMYRNIATQAIFQLIILLGVLFFGPQLFGVPSSKNMEKWEPERAVHYTMFFNIFVMLQLFNLINSRKLKKEETNVFENFFNNNMFLFVLAISFFIQILLVEIGGEAIRVVSLDFNHHILCIVIGSLSLVCCYVSKQIPDEFFNNFKMFRDDVKQEEILKEPTFVEKMRRESRQRRSMRQRSMGSFHKVSD